MSDFVTLDDRLNVQPLVDLAWVFCLGAAYEGAQVGAVGVR
jgi:hypothetical protein